jgi:hypothetical protein
MIVAFVMPDEAYLCRYENTLKKYCVEQRKKQAEKAKKRRVKIT